MVKTNLIVRGVSFWKFSPCNSTLRNLKFFSNIFIIFNFKQTVNFCDSLLILTKFHCTGSRTMGGVAFWNFQISIDIGCNVNKSEKWFLLKNFWDKKEYVATLKIIFQFLQNLLNCSEKTLFYERIKTTIVLTLQNYYHSYTKTWFLLQHLLLCQIFKWHTIS